MRPTPCNAENIHTRPLENRPLFSSQPMSTASSTANSVTGLDRSIPFCVVQLPGSCFCTGSVRDRHLMEFEEDKADQI